MDSGDEEPLDGQRFHFPDNDVQPSQTVFDMLQSSTVMPNDMTAMLNSVAAKAENDCISLNQQFQAFNNTAGKNLLQLQQQQEAIGRQVIEIHENHKKLEAAVSDMSAKMDRMMDMMGAVTSGAAKVPRITTIASASGHNTPTRPIV